MSTAGPMVLEVRRLRAGYPGMPILHGCDLDVREGEMVGIAGLNGAGKSTLLRALSGVITRSCDRALFRGAKLPARPDAVARLGLVHVPEGRRVFPNLTVTENLRYGAAAAGKVADASRQERLVLDAFPRLADLAERRAALLSGGEQQMLAVARGLMAKPVLLMVDELSLGLSPKAGLEISAALAQVARAEGVSVLLVDQNTTLLGARCDRGYLLRDGLTEPISDAFGHETLSAAYF
ncbi:branched-chain amino acid ABC transporter ATPase [Mycobacterium tuberculosis]|nr:branched-chain amino acid ABC transporter ATPase [Mycobacterium tuberculosis]